MEPAKNYYFIYPKDKNNKRTGQTICVVNVLDPESNEPKSFYGITTCSEDDQFEYVIGRDLAYERAVAAWNAYLARRKKTS